MAMGTSADKVEPPKQLGIAVHLGLHRAGPEFDLPGRRHRRGSTWREGDLRRLPCKHCQARYVEPQMLGSVPFAPR